MKHIITKNSPGERVLLLGNEAVARGAIESNIEIAASYPGTPASEIIDTLALIADEFNMHVEWSTNEMVAFEVAIGGALCGKRSMASMKHIGANWIMDPLMHAVYHGFNSSLIIVSADDPSGHSSANEQDNRYMALMAEIPALEPSGVQEAKDYVKIAAEFSEKIRLPVMIRLVTRICHSRGDVILGEIEHHPAEPNFHDDYYRDFVLGEGIVGPKVIPQLHEILHEKLKRVENLAKEKSLFRIERASDGPFASVGVISSSVALNYVMDFLKYNDLRGKINLLKLGMTNPFPESTVSDFIEGLESVIVVEEGEPFIERQLIGVAKDHNPRLKIFGKLSNHLPRTGELNFSAVGKAFSLILGIKYDTSPPKEKLEILEKSSKMLTPRTLTMCSGCPHRAAYYAARKAIKTVSKGRYIAIGDIGCYTLGMYPPLKFMQDVFCMGGSIGIANGIAQTGINDPVIATIGDSTFYHAGVPALINATFNKANIKVMVLDNYVTGMTGYQPHPGSGQTAMGSQTKKVNIEDISRACGIDFIKIVDPYDQKGSVAVMEEALKFPGPAVVIFRRICAQEYLRIARRKSEKIIPCVVLEEKCIGCRTCVAAFGCPAMGFNTVKKKSYINALDCTGCKVCIAVCPYGAIKQSEW
ncbi:MAG: indolepyruvate ferredoxin oxidoreductase subunit alpha [Candidatus Methanomethyliaceae archaeon]|nr:indolepyruvate ferredoxin oxidoreductase subunit alpha [Candidatus Methanomethyliaceae archaeon]